MSRKGWLLFAAMCVIWGIPYLLIRVAVRDVNPAFLVCSRTLLGGLMLLPVALAKGGFRKIWPHWRPLLAFVVVELAIPWLFLSDAETKLSSSLSGLLVAAVPLIGVLIARVGGGETRIEPMRIIGLFMGLAGVAALVGLDLGQLNIAAVVEVGFVVLGYAIAPAIQARYLSDLPSIPVVAVSLTLVALFYLPFAVASPPSHLSGESVWAIVVLGVVCTAAAFVIFFALIAAVGPARAVVITYVNPAVAVILGVALLGEHFTVGIAVGFPLILAGSVLAARKARLVPIASETHDGELPVPLVGPVPSVTWPGTQTD
jgi:drug/metabolite transporter (DMT)-like permease